MFLKNILPTFFFEITFIFPLWKWFVLLAFLLIGFIVKFIVHFSLEKFLLRKHKGQFKDAISLLLNPISYFIILLSFYIGISFIDLKDEHYQFLTRSIFVAFSILFIWTLHRIISLVSEVLYDKVQLTESKSDDLLVPMLHRLSLVVLYSFGIILILERLGTDVKSLLAGLGIGGLAFAFAAKDMLANVFGSFMILLDRPFDIGDIIVTDKVEGTVEQVGFRSTRVRTFFDSLITVPNGVLANLTIDNRGKRRFRRYSTKLNIVYSTPAAKIEAFCHGIRDIIIKHPWTHKEKFNVYLSDLSSSSLDILVHVYWTTEAYDRELNERHRFLIDILRLAHDLNVDFAFPTQTLHMYSEGKFEESANGEVEEKLEESIDGVEKKVLGVIQKPMSLKNPSSNLKDYEDKKREL
ncbi:mechanosensitive ion channel family protein [bacterium]|nr:mechanosensitive ion channel family protein [bacterium]